uniref:Uncharacterized protein n=1 Tax=Paramormyrops kingsleyae TaxID=1676925 RepID=A0A3B3RPT3_9TELE
PKCGLPSSITCSSVTPGLCLIPPSEGHPADHSYLNQLTPGSNCLCDTPAPLHVSTETHMTKKHPASRHRHLNTVICCQVDGRRSGSQNRRSLIKNQPTQDSLLCACPVFGLSRKQPGTKHIFLNLKQV